jgi:hypothetical protein
LFYEANELFTEFASTIKSEVLAEDFSEVSEEPGDFDYEKEVKVDGVLVQVWLKK